MMKIYIMLVGAAIMLTAGCDSLRFAPGQIQKQNAWLHNRTAQIAADTAWKDEVSVELKELTGLCELQSRAFVADYGLPKQFPRAASIDDILTESNRYIAATAIGRSAKRPNAWEAAEAMMDIGIAAAGLLGGVWGLKVASVLKRARQNSTALRQIVEGNELFKTRQAESAEAFKTAHKNQSPQTRQIVQQIKNS